MDVIYVFRCKVNRIKTAFREEALKTEPESADFLYAVTVIKTAYDRADNVVQTRAETTAGTDSGVYMRRIKVNVFTGTCLLHEVVSSQPVFFL